MYTSFAFSLGRVPNVRLQNHRLQNCRASKSRLDVAISRERNSCVVQHSEAGLLPMTGLLAHLLCIFQFGYISEIASAEAATARP